MSEFRLNQRTCRHKSDLQCPLQHACLSLCWCKWNTHFLIAWCTENISYCALFLARKTYELLNSMQGTEKFDCLYSSSESVAICVTQTIFYLLADNRVVFCCWTTLKASATFQGHDKQTKKNFLSCALARESGLRDIVKAWCDHFFYGKEQSCFAGKAYQFESVSSYILFS